MPPPGESDPVKTLRQVADDGGLYPVEAFEFVQLGLSFTVNRIHGKDASTSQGGSPSQGASPSQGGSPSQSRHVTGQQLCEGLRDYALQQWGLLAKTVLGRWNVTSTLDFGRIVFSLVAGGLLKTTEGDTLEDFRNVYDFKTAFEAGYRIESKA